MPHSWSTTGTVHWLYVLDACTVVVLEWKPDDFWTKLFVFLYRYGIEHLHNENWGSTSISMFLVPFYLLFICWEEITYFFLHVPRRVYTKSSVTVHIHRVHTHEVTGHIQKHSVKKRKAYMILQGRDQGSIILLETQTCRRQKGQLAWINMNKSLNAGASNSWTLFFKHRQRAMLVAGNVEREGRDWRESIPWLIIAGRNLQVLTTTALRCDYMTHFITSLVGHFNTFIFLLIFHNDNRMGIFFFHLGGTHFI